MRKLLLSLLTLSSVALGVTVRVGAYDDIDGLGTAQNLVLNTGCEKNTLGFVASGSSVLSRNTTAGNIGFGDASCGWDASATGEFLTSTAKTIPQGLYGQPSVVTCSYKTAATDVKLQAFDGTSVLATTTLAAQATYGRGSVNFTMPSTGSISLRLASQSNSAIIYIDQCYLGVTPTGSINNPMTTGGDTIYGGSGGTPTRLANGNPGQVLTSQGSTVAPIWGTNQNPASVTQRFTTGSGTYNLPYAFSITSGSATVGATYTNNSVTYTVYATVSSATLVYMSGNGAPTSSGTLTKASGTGDSTITFMQVYAPRNLTVIICGGGGGGGPTGVTTSGTAGTSGGTSTFGSTVASCPGGGGASTGNTATPGAAAASCTLTSAAIIIYDVGGTDGNVVPSQTVSISVSGGAGGASVLSGAGRGGLGANDGVAAFSNSCSGGGGAGSNGVVSGSASGGAAGAYANFLLQFPSVTYAYAVGGGGSAGVAGTSGKNGGAGGSGFISVRADF